MKSGNGNTGNDEDEMDRILSREDEILPSSGFAVSVMEAVRREAAVPPPIAFPWKRALPGMVVGGIALIVGLVAGVAVIVRLAKTSVFGGETNGATCTISSARPPALPRTHRIARLFAPVR